MSSKLISDLIAQFSNEVDLIRQFACVMPNKSLFRAITVHCI